MWAVFILFFYYVDADCNYSIYWMDMRKKSNNEQAPIEKEPSNGQRNAYYIQSASVGKMNEVIIKCVITHAASNELNIVIDQ